jgi:hypothetical protein
MLKLTTKGTVRFSWASEAMEAIWALSPSDSEEELLAKMKLIVRFVEEQGKPPLPERWPGVGLEVAQMAHPAPVDPDAPVPYFANFPEKPTEPVVTNGWAATAGVVPPAPDLPARLQGEVELIPPEEQG